MLDPEAVNATARLYADDDRLTDPYVSPLYGDFSGLPPILVQVSSAEMLFDNARRVAERARLAGVLPEADEALFGLALWLEETLR